MKSFAIAGLCLALVACGSGSSGNSPAPETPSGDPTTQSPLDDGAAFTLVTCVPVYNVGGTKLNVDTNPPASPNVGTACSGVAPLFNSDGSVAHYFIINGNANVPCGANAVDTPQMNDAIQYFWCAGNPFA